MKMTGLIGVVVGGLSIALGATLEGSNVAAVINIPALFIVLGGTLGASMGGAGFDAIKAIPMLYKKAFFPDELDLPRRVAELVGYAEKARRDGLLALDEQLATVEDPYTRKGLQLVVDGTDPELVAEVLEAENEAMRKRHAACVQPFDKAGGYAPTMGIIGTVFGLVHVLTNLSQPETLGPMISAAFIATLLGVASANVVYLPVSARLKGLSQEELHFREMTLEGILAIQAGENPRFVNEKLMAYVPPSKRPTEEDLAQQAKAASGAGADAEKAAA
ncbi:MAG TPA: flagellar motor protein [Thermoleophilaceae bacterium]|jgi:chemotaxis protein MotA|nr:flagellar motor protein [Thermoleophilaceae bacterium]